MYVLNWKVFEFWLLFLLCTDALKAINYRFIGNLTVWGLLQCDQMARLLVQYFAICNDEICSMAKNRTSSFSYCQILNKPTKYCPKHWQYSPKLQIVARSGHTGPLVLEATAQPTCHNQVCQVLVLIFYVAALTGGSMTDIRNPAWRKPSTWQAWLLSD